MDVTIVKYNAGNIYSVVNAMKRLGIEPVLTDDAEMLQKFRTLTGVDLRVILPQVLPAGADAGGLTEEGAKLLDPSGDLQPGIPFCPPEGDAGTGMTATNAVRVRTGNDRRGQAA